MRGQIPVVVDCDPGIDDALALVYLTGKPGVELAGVSTVHGNVPASTGARNALKSLEVGGASGIPVAVGVDRPLLRAADTAEEVHGQDGIGDAGLGPPREHPEARGGAVRLLEWIRARPGEVALLAIGPLTNVAVALLIEPDLPRLVRRLVVMGGAVYGPGNVTPAAEFNIWHDPEAAHVVFSAPWNVTLIGLDVTNQARLEGGELRRLETAPGSRARFSSAILAGYLGEEEARTGVRAAFMHDPLAAAVLLDPTLVRCRKTPLAVELTGEARGATRPGPVGSGPLVDVAVEVDRERFCREFVDAVAGS